MRLASSYSFEFDTNKMKSKITNIEFITNEQALVTSNDSKIRLIKVSNGLVLKEFIGCKNEDTMIRGSYEEISNRVVCSSDDGVVFVWNNNSSKDKNITLLKHKHISVDSFDYFIPFKTKKFDPKEQSLPQSTEINENTPEIATICVCSVFINNKMLSDYSEKVNMFIKEIFVKHLIVNCSNKGSVQVLVNLDHLKTFSKKYLKSSTNTAIKSDHRLL